MIVLHNVIVLRVSYTHIVVCKWSILLYATCSSTLVQASAQLILTQLSVWKHALLIQLWDWQTSSVTGLPTLAVISQGFCGGPSCIIALMRSKHRD